MLALTHYLPEAAIPLWRLWYMAFNSDCTVFPRLPERLSSLCLSFGGARALTPLIQGGDVNTRFPEPTSRLAVQETLRNAHRNSRSARSLQTVGLRARVQHYGPGAF